MSALSLGDHLATAAEALVGSRFRLHGRNPDTGLDCVGVLAVSLKAIGREPKLPNAYRLRSRAIPGLSQIAQDCGLIRADGDVKAGDVLLARIGSCQFHVLIAANSDRVIHAHAGIGRVVIGPPGEDWHIAGHWRLT